MRTFEIAGLVVNMDFKHKILSNQAKKYEVSYCDNADITINYVNEDIENMQKENPHLSIDECEYIFFGSQFYRELLNFNGFVLHSSCVAVDVQAYLFSAPCGTGKSTHTQLWQEYFGKEKAVIINDDKPAIRFIDNQFYAFGTPFSGKTDLNENIMTKIKGIVFLEQSKENHIDKMSNKMSILSILNQTIRPREAILTVNLLGMIDSLVKLVPIYKLGCNISVDAVQLVYNTLNNKEGLV